MSAGRALLVGNSDGIGRALTSTLAVAGWQVAGLSRSDLAGPAGYVHVTRDVTAPAYPAALCDLWDAHGPFDLVVHCVGIGSGLDADGFAGEAHTIRTNFVSLVELVEALVPRMVARGRGHLIGLSSIADDLHLADAPSYCASKAGYSTYLRALALHLRPAGVAVTNVRFGFVDTKMAKSDHKPMMIPAAKAADLLLRCVRRRPIQLTYPKMAGALVRLVRWWQNAVLWTRRGSARGKKRVT